MFVKYDKNTGEVILINYLGNAVEQNEVNVKSIPNPDNRDGMIAVLHIDKETNSLFYKYTKREFTTEEKVAQLSENIKSKQQKYAELDINKANLQEVKEAKIAELKEKCNSSIEDGFISPSIKHKFGYKTHDQNNLYGQMLVFMADTTETQCEWKTEDAGVIILTKEQFMKLVPEGKEHVREKVAHFWNLVAMVTNCQFKTDVAKINW